MGLLSFFSKTADASAARSETLGDAVAQARTRARRRLIGAVVLVGLGVIGFPLLFETQPRPIPVDLPIVIPRKDAVPALVPPAPRASAPRMAVAVAPSAKDQVLTETRADAGREIPAPAVRASAPASATAASPVLAAPSMTARATGQASATVRPAEKGIDKPAEKLASKTPEDTRARSLLEGKATEDKPKPAAAADARVVVQVGAFAEVTAAREVRQKVEKLGLKTYTQVVETDAGRRIRVRVGPFASRDEADKAASRIKSAGLPAAVLAL